ncbi:fibrillarin-like rRNA/tRNA 2'-O-methyltransferase [Candidatus Woesearchaeota archaeon]|nr:fibrillarin-like rRNA/tRNA 2'-O-methyltransferase [Candidatus Woesearchaeota archaeon]
MSVTPSRFSGLFEMHGKKLLFLTKNLIAGTQFGEQLISAQGTEYRVIDPTRSKLGAALMKGISQLGVKPGDVALYLGASYGYTPSFVSDLLGETGFVFCIDSAPRSTRDLVFLCEQRSNMAPVLADAFHPEAYASRVSGADFVYQDIAQRNQAEIFLKNCDLFLKPGGFAVLVVKARSIDVTKKPGVIFQQVRRQLGEHIAVVDYRVLDPFEKDHCLLVCKKKI